MKITAFALLLSGIITSTLIPLTSVNAGDQSRMPAPSQWQGSKSATTARPAWNLTYDQAGPSGSKTGMPKPYRFRPWADNTPQEWRAQPQPSWRESTAMNHNPWRGGRNWQGASSIPRASARGYRFRPLPQGRQQPAPQSAGVTYRPADIKIPGHYVYRPINPVRKPQSAKYTPSRIPTWPPAPYYGYISSPPPMMPMAPVYGYTPYLFREDAPSPGHQPRSMNQPERRARYVYGDAPYQGLRFRPVTQTFRHPYYSHRHDMNRMPPLAFSRWRDRLRFRPSAEFDRRNYFPPNQTYAQAYNPLAYPYPNMAYNRLEPSWTEPGANYPRSYPVWDEALHETVDNSNGYQGRRIDWYDGRSDGDGAWYKLAEQAQWPPRVSQTWPGE
jgi:hypothetical protein